MVYSLCFVMISTQRLHVLAMTAVALPILKNLRRHHRTTSITTIRLTAMTKVATTNPPKPTFTPNLHPLLLQEGQPLTSRLLVNHPICPNVLASVYSTSWPHSVRDHPCLFLKHPHVAEDPCVVTIRGCLHPPNRNHALHNLPPQPLWLQPQLSLTTDLSVLAPVLCPTCRSHVSVSNRLDG